MFEGRILPNQSMWIETNINGVISWCLFSAREVSGFWIEGCSFKGSENLVKSCMKISLGSNEVCERKILQEVLGASGFKGFTEMVTLSHRSLFKRNKHAGSICPIKADLQAAYTQSKQACRQHVPKSKHAYRQLFCPIEEFSLQGAHVASKSWPSIASMQAAHLANLTAELKESYFPPNLSKCYF